MKDFLVGAGLFLAGALAICLWLIYYIAIPLAILAIAWHFISKFW